MKQVQRTRVQKKYFVSIILLCVFAFALATSLVLTKIIPLILNNSQTPSDTTGGLDFELVEGEASQSGMPMSYPSIEKKMQIEYIRIQNKDGTFGILKGTGDNYHTLFYEKDGKDIAYIPDIAFADPDNFNYSNILAIETGDGIGRYSLVDYLCSAVQTPYFNDRIEVERDPDNPNRLNEDQLKNYGLGYDEAKIMMVTYTDNDGKRVHRTIRIGDLGVIGTGYYYTVTDTYTVKDENGNDEAVQVERPYIYASLNNYFGYAESGIADFVKPLLVSEGLYEDNGFGPYLTTGYYQWKNRLYACICPEEECVPGTCQPSECVRKCSCGSYKTVEDSRVIVYADTVFPILADNDGDGLLDGGYQLSGKKLTEINVAGYNKALAELLTDPNFVPGIESRNYERMINVLSGKKLGAYKNTVTTYSAYSSNMQLNFTDSDTVSIVYTVTAVEAIITDGSDITAAGASLGEEYDALKVTYTAIRDGKPISNEPLHAVIDLRYADGIDEASKAKLRSAEIGEDVNITFTVLYNKENSTAKNENVKYVITEIVEILDKDGKAADKITETSFVKYRYETYIDNVLIGERISWRLDLGSIEIKENLSVGEEESSDSVLKRKLIGKALGKVNVEVDNNSAYYEYMFDFDTFEIEKVDSYVTSELVSAFKFQNASQRDPYYGESLYESLFDEGDSRNLYGLSSGVCETLVKILGGLSDESSSGTASGLSGDKVVAVGITPDVMQKYGLYAHTIYFELPRGISSYEPDDAIESNGEKLDDYIFRSTLGFNLYISEVDPETNMRYIGSDLYDIVTRVPADDFVFLKYDFETFWARRNFIFVQTNTIETLGVEFLMDDLKGKYEFEVSPLSSANNTISVFVTASGECTPNAFTEYMASNYPKTETDGVVGASLKNLYLYMSNATEEEFKSAGSESLGASCFRDITRLMYFVSYVDILSEEERADAPDPDSLVMRMTLKLDKDINKNASENTYVYGFYRIDDRRVRVSITEVSPEGETVNDSVDDFYISSFAFKKIVNAFVGVLNAEVIDITDGYEK